MATLSDCDQVTIGKESKRKASSSNLILSNQQNEASKFELITNTASNQINSYYTTTQVNQAATLKTINSNQLNNNKSTKSTAANGELIGPLDLNNNFNGLADSAKITEIAGKLIAVRKDGNSYTFTTNTTSITNSAAKKLTLTTPSKGNATLITVSKPHPTTLNNANKTDTSNGSTLITTSTPQRFYYNKATNTIQGDLQTNNQIITSKPIILQMKRKIQVLNEETRKTARIFTIPCSKEQNLINKQTNLTKLSNQFIVMNRPLIKPNLMTNSSLIKGTSIATKPITANIEIVGSSSNEQRSSALETRMAKLKTGDLNLQTSETAALTIISKQILNELPTNLMDNKIDTKIDAKVLDSLLVTDIQNDKILNNLTTQTAATLPDRSAGGLSTVSIKQERQNLLNDTNSRNNDNKTVNVDAKNLLFENLTGEQIIENAHVLAIENCFVVENERMTDTTTTIENIIESTIENSFQNSSSLHSSFHKNTPDDTCTSQQLVNTRTDCIKIEPDIEFSPNSTASKQLAANEELSLASSQSLTNGDCSQPKLNMQTDSTLGSSDDNLIMDECAAALVLMSLSFSPKNHYPETQPTSLHLSSIISQKVVFQCTWRNEHGGVCGKESENREQIKQHVRQHLGYSISSSNADHEEDFYYTEIDVSKQDSSGVSSADSPDRSPMGCSEELTKFCACNQIKFESHIGQEDFDDEIYDEILSDDDHFVSKSVKAKKIKEIRLNRLNNQQRGGKDRSSKAKKNNTALVWTKKGLLKCSGTLDLIRGRVGRPRRLKLNSQSLSKTTSGILKKCSSNIKKQEKNLSRCGLFKRSASSPIAIPGISIAHQSYSNGNNNNSVNQDLLDISYNSDQFKVGSMRSNSGLLEQCMSKQQQPCNNQNRQKHPGYDCVSNFSTSTSSSGVPASIDTIDSAGTSVLSINSLASSATSSSPSSPSLMSNFSTGDQDDWIFLSDLNRLSSIADRTNKEEDDYFFESKYNAELCKSNSLFATHNHSIKKSNANSLLTKTKNHSQSLDQRENVPFASRSARQIVTLISQKQQTTTSKQSQKTIGYYANLHRGIIQPPNQPQNFVHPDHLNSLQSSNHQAPSNTKNNTKNQTARRSKNANGKCRKKYGMENKQSWCLQCRWKKACSRVDSNNNGLTNLTAENELSSSRPTLV